MNHSFVTCLYQLPKVISTHFRRLVTDSATLNLKAHLKERLDDEAEEVNLQLSVSCEKLPCESLFCDMAILIGALSCL